jgi:phosphoribosylglycinamide formyltransferase-1
MPQPHRSLVLVCEGGFHPSYLISSWLRRFPGAPILIRDDPDRTPEYEKRWSAHHAHTGRPPTGRVVAHFDEVYGGMSPTELAMAERYGIPPLPERMPAEVRLAGADLNSDDCREWLMKAVAESDPVIFVFLDQLLHDWWISLTRGQIINAHSAVLPHARGMFAIEQVAASQDVSRFVRAAGASAHYVDSGVDTGPVILARRLAAPFGHDSIWSCKGRSFLTAFGLILQLAESLRDDPETLPVGHLLDSRGTPVFRRLEFTPSVRAAAEQGFLAMKSRTAAASGNGRI